MLITTSKKPPPIRHFYAIYVLLATLGVTAMQTPPSTPASALAPATRRREVLRPTISGFLSAELTLLEDRQDRPSTHLLPFPGCMCSRGRGRVWYDPQGCLPGLALRCTEASDGRSSGERASVARPRPPPYSDPREQASVVRPRPRPRGVLASSDAQPILRLLDPQDLPAQEFPEVRPSRLKGSKAVPSPRARLEGSTSSSAAVGTRPPWPRPPLHGRARASKTASPSALGWPPPCQRAASSLRMAAALPARGFIRPGPPPPCQRAAPSPEAGHRRCERAASSSPSSSRSPSTYLVRPPPCERAAHPFNGRRRSARGLSSTAAALERAVRTQPTSQLWPSPASRTRPTYPFNHQDRRPSARGPLHASSEPALWILQASPTSALLSCD